MLDALYKHQIGLAGGRRMCSTPTWYPDHQHTTYVFWKEEDSKQEKTAARAIFDYMLKNDREQRKNRLTPGWQAVQF
ncbi:MAG: hypothetical protein WBN96_00695 [Gammaproteobacteria bacterium]